MTTTAATMKTKKEKKRLVKYIMNILSAFTSFGKTLHRCRKLYISLVNDCKMEENNNCG